MVARSTSNRRVNGSVALPARGRTNPAVGAAFKLRCGACSRARVKNRRVAARSRFSQANTSITCPDWSARYRYIHRSETFARAVGLVDEPAITGGVPAGSSRIDQKPGEPLDPPIHRHVIHFDATLREQSPTAGSTVRRPLTGPSWVRIFVVGLVLWSATVLVTFATENSNLIPTIILLGSFLTPITFVAYAFGRADQVITAQRIFSAFVYGGLLGVLGASVLESAFLRQPSGLAYVGVGLIEEGVKLAALWLLARRLRTRCGMRPGVSRCG